jgi:1-acyl-sn-glycerol-3-phosphate acyltransferase
VRVFGAYDAFPKGAKLPNPVPIDVVFGKALHFSEKETAEASRENYQRLSDRVMDAIAAIPHPKYNPPAAAIQS